MKKITFISILAFLWISTMSIAQNHTDLTGCIIDEKEDRAALKASPDNRIGSRADESVTKVDMREDIYIEQQRGKTCVSHAIAHALTIMWVRKEGVLVSRDIEKYSFSPYYIHNQIAANCAEPTRITEGLNVVKEHGIALTADFKSDDNCTTQPDRETRNKALKYSIKDYLTVFLKDYTDEEKIIMTKKQLAKGYPVIIGVNIPKVFYGIEKGVRVLDADETDLSANGHALCVVGYDDFRGAFEVMNSWGTDWANDGYIWVKYDDYARYAKYGYIAILGSGKMPKRVPENTQIVKATKKIDLEGKFALRTFTGYDDNKKPLFESETPVLDNNTYLFSDWNGMNSYQLVGTDMTENSYIYVFSIDAKNKSELHFPKTTRDIDMDAAEEIPLNSIVPSKVPSPVPSGGDTPEISDATMVLPNDVTALQSVYAGTDNICVIYSDNRIDDIQQRIEQVRRTTQKDFNKRLNAGFDDILIPTRDIEYTADGMSFKARSDKGTAVPLVLNVIVNE